MPGAYLATKYSPLVTSEWQAWLLICIAIVGIFIVVVGIFKS